MRRDQQTDFPFDECTAQVEALLAAEPTTIVHQKFTCQNCGTRQTMEEPNKFYTNGRCEECGHITDIKHRGCNYLVIRRLRK